MRHSGDGAEIEKLSQGAGTHHGVLSPDGEHLVDVHTCRGHAAVVRLLRPGAGIVSTLFGEERITPGDLGLNAPELVQVPAADGRATLFGAVYSPPNREPGRRYPVVVSVYGGPHVQRCVDDWYETVDLRAQYLAQQGFVVLKLDNRGSSGRGLAFEAELALNMGTVEVDDQVAARVRAPSSPGL